MKLLWLLLALSCLDYICAQDEGETKEPPSGGESSTADPAAPFKLSKYSLLVKDLQLNLTYDGGSSRLALTKGLPLAIQIYDTSKQVFIA